MIKKRLSILLVIAFVIISVMTGARAENDDYTLYYFNSFDNGVADLKPVDNDLVRLSIGTDRPRDAVFNGNSGIGKNLGDWTSDEKTLAFSFKNGGIKDRIVKISYDFAVRSEGSSDSSFAGINMYNFYQGGRLFYIDRWSAKAIFSESVGDTVTRDVETSDDTLYHVEFWLNLIDGTETTYLNGEKIVGPSTLQDSYRTIEEFSVSISGRYKYIDNIRIESYKSIPMNVEASNDNGEINLKFTDYINSDSLTDKIFIVKNSFTNESKEISGVQKNGNTLVLSDEFITEGYAYTVTMPNGIAGINGNETKNTIVSVSPKDGKYLKNINYKDLFKETVSITDEVPSRVNEIDLTFTDSVNAENLKNDIEIYENNVKASNFSITAASMEAFIKFNSTLKPNSTYRLHILKGSETDMEYDITFVTDSGEVVLKSAEFYNGTQKVNTMNDVKKGDMIKVKMDFINTSEADRTFLASACMLNGLAMTDFDYKIVTMSTSEKQKTIEFDFTITNSESPKIKTFMWQGLGENIALCSEKVLK